MPHVIWDMDGVLLDSEPIYLQVESAITSRFGKDVNEILPELLGSTASDAAEITVRSLNLPLTPSEYLEERNAALSLLFPSVRTVPGSSLHVTHFAAHGARQAVATSSPAGLLALKRQRHGALFSHFAAVVCGDDVVKGKPDPAIFLEAARRIDADPADCVVIEDAPAGVRAARAAGMKVVALMNKVVGPQRYWNDGANFVVESGTLLDFDCQKIGFPQCKGIQEEKDAREKGTWKELGGDQPRL